MFTEKEYRTLDGLSVIYWIKKGSSKAPALFFVHGVGGNSTAWSGIIRNLESLGRTIIRLDLRCHGKSEMSMSRRFYGIDKIVNDIGGILDAEKIDRAVFVAHSFGGTCVLKHLLKKNSRAAGAVLCNSPHSNPKEYTSSLLLRYLHPILNLFIWMVATASPLRKKKYPYPDYFKLRDLSEIGLWFHDISAAPVRVFFYNYLLLMKLDMSLAEISSIPVEFLLFTSDKDPFLSKRSVYDLSKIVRTHKLIEIKGCDHETILRKEDEVSNGIAAFIRHLSENEKITIKEEPCERCS